MGMERTCKGGGLSEGQLKRQKAGAREEEAKETYIVLFAELLGEGSAHDDTALAGGSLEVSGTALASRRRND